MRKTCIVKGCSSNKKVKVDGPNGSEYARKYVTIFSFPLDSNLKQQWLNAIPCINGQLTKDKGVCIRHFQPGDIKDLKSKKLLESMAVPAISDGFITRVSFKHNEYLKIKKAKELSNQSFDH